MTEKQKLIEFIKLLKQFKKASKAEQKKIINELESQVKQYE